MMAMIMFVTAILCTALAVKWYFQLEVRVTRNPTYVSKFLELASRGTLSALALDERGEPKWFARIVIETAAFDVGRVTLYAIIIEVPKERAEPVKEVIIIGKTGYFEELFEIKDVEDVLSVYSTPKCLFDTGGTRRDVRYKQHERREKQTEVIAKIVDHYKEHGRVSVLVTGKPGVGKSEIATIIANDLNGVLCFDWNPTIPNRGLDVIYNDVRPSAKRPLVLLLNEVDIILSDVMEKNIKPVTDFFSTSVANKGGWNDFTDSLKFYDHIILVMTSNKTHSEMTQVEESLLRANRVNIVYEM